jgi:hypothetical protein
MKVRTPDGRFTPSAHHSNQGAKSERDKHHIFNTMIRPGKASRYVPLRSLEEAILRAGLP